jgi:hypothetical protein
MIDAIKYYHMITHKYRRFKIIDEKFISYYLPEYQSMIFSNTTFHYETNLHINFQIIKDLYDFYILQNCKGDLFSYSNEINKFSAFHE